MQKVASILYKTILLRLLIVGGLSVALIFSLRTLGVSENYILMAITAMSVILIFIDTASNREVE